MIKGLPNINIYIMNEKEEDDDEDEKKGLLSKMLKKKEKKDEEMLAEMRALRIKTGGTSHVGGS